MEPQRDQHQEPFLGSSDAKPLVGKQKTICIALILFGVLAVIAAIIGFIVDSKGGFIFGLLALFAGVISAVVGFALYSIWTSAKRRNVITSFERV